MLRPVGRGAALAALFALPELAYLAGSLAAPRPGPGGSCAVIVLGFPARKDGAPSAVQRFRMDLAVAAYRELGCSKLVLSGGKPHSETVEAEVMARVAREAGLPPESLFLETQASDTWENVRYSLRHVEGFDRILIASDSLHAHRARRYLCRQRPELCGRAAVWTRYLPFSLYALKWGGLFNEAWAWIRDAARPRPRPEMAL